MKHTNRKKKESSLGKSLQRSRYGRTGENEDLAVLYTTDDLGKEQEKMKSYTADKSDLEELMADAELEDRRFVAEKQNVVILSSSAMQVKSDYDVDKQRQLQWNVLTMPKRPKWTKETTAEQLKQMEKESFGEWRRKLAEIEEQEKFLITPFEKNLEVWRQLWRVIERSDLVCQILDARNPLLFRSPSMEAYVKEVDERKVNMVVVNKADLLSKRQRQAWANYFQTQGLRYAFFSAFIEEMKAEDPEFTVKPDPAPETHIYTKEELLKLFTDLCPKPIDPEFSGGKITVGLVGYPNVGKSSTINVICGSKKVAVAATPGKTKHFQTINLTDEIILCDCPGLVFPTVMGTAADMVCCGLLPIHQMRDFISPVDLVCQRIPRDALESTYGVVLPPPGETEPQDRPPKGDELLNAYAYVRGFMTASGLPDQSRAARIVLTHYVSGKLIYCHPPPGVEAKSFQVKRSREKEPAPSAKKDQPEKKKKPTYLANATRSAGDDTYYDYLTKQDKVKAKTSGREGTGYTRALASYYTPIPVSQLKKDPRAMELLYGDDLE
eukprot:Phypoly_transcript_06553.p1 GENE.Phypoly_transcript_06553~~Phypoly_transcript_06553.p1  ORF type:complete len:552 (+),score=75.03 Phypoly_transcript_06553:68-1723(+)